MHFVDMVIQVHFVTECHIANLENKMFNKYMKKPCLHSIVIKSMKLQNHMFCFSINTLTDRDRFLKM